VPGLNLLDGLLGNGFFLFSLAPALWRKQTFDGQTWFMRDEAISHFQTGRSQASAALPNIDCGRPGLARQGVPLID